MASDIDLTLALANTATAAAQHWYGGRGVFMAVASAYGTAKLQYLAPDKTTWLDVDTSATLSANGMVGVELPPGQVRVVLTGTTAASAWLLGSRVD